MITGRIGRSLLLITSLFAVLVGVRSAKGLSNCSLATLKGTYGGLEQGTIVAQLPGFPPPPSLFAATAIHVYDGAGNLSHKATASIGGTIVPGTLTGTYTVNPDCAYSHELKLASGLVIHAVGTIAGQGIFQKIHQIWSVAGTVIFQTFTKMPLGGCSLATLKGTYSLLGQGTVTAQLPGFPPPPVLVAHNGTVIFDGNGTLSGGDVSTVNGVIVPRTFTGTYTVDPNCAALFVINFADGSVLHEAGTITGAGILREIDTIATDAGWVFADAAKKQ
jgi:hypothetical protein